MLVLSLSLSLSLNHKANTSNKYARFFVQFFFNRASLLFFCLFFHSLIFCVLCYAVLLHYADFFLPSLRSFDLAFLFNFIFFSWLCWFCSPKTIFFSAHRAPILRSVCVFHTRPDDSFAMDTH